MISLEYYTKDSFQKYMDELSELQEKESPIIYFDDEQIKKLKKCDCAVILTFRGKIEEFKRYLKLVNFFEFTQRCIGEVGIVIEHTVVSAALSDSVKITEIIVDIMPIDWNYTVGLFCDDDADMKVNLMIPMYRCDEI